MVHRRKAIKQTAYQGTEFISADGKNMILIQKTPERLIGGFKKKYILDESYVDRRGIEQIRVSKEFNSRSVAEKFARKRIKKW